MNKQFNERFIKNYNDDSNKGYLIELMFKILKVYATFTIIYPFCLEDWIMEEKN